jgi:hypothetical protein
MSPTATGKAMVRETANLEIPGLNKPLSAPDNTITGVENTMLGYEKSVLTLSFLVALKLWFYV